MLLFRVHLIRDKTLFCFHTLHSCAVEWKKGREILEYVNFNLMTQSFYRLSITIAFC